MIGLMYEKCGIYVQIIERDHYFQKIYMYIYNIKKEKKAKKLAFLIRQLSSTRCPTFFAQEIEKAFM